MNRGFIKATIFDLDNCLAPAKAVGEQLYDPAFNAIRQANAGAIPKEMLERALNDIWRHPFDWVAANYGFTPAMRDAGWRVFVEMEVNHSIRGYSDLTTIQDLPTQRYLVTSGFRRLQESKIKALGLDPFFDEIHVDAIDEPHRLGKQGLFQHIMRSHNLIPDEVLVVGDSADSEIKAGNRLGLTTVQILRSGVEPASNADYHCNSLAELKNVLDL